MSGFCPQVSKKGKHDVQALGGHWEPCDGDHPESDLGVLQQTAVRTFLEATGVDLSSCTNW